MLGRIAKGMVGISLPMSIVLSMLVTAKKHATVTCAYIDIQVKEHPEQSLITPNAIVDLLQENYKINLIGQPLKKINSYDICNKLAMQPVVKTVLVFKTWPATLHIFLETKQLLARFIKLEHPNDHPLYVDENGDILTLRGIPLCRLLIISTSSEERLKENLTRYDKGLLALLHHLYTDRFLRYQITSLQIATNHNLILGTQVGNHQILFGKPENILEKLEKLHIFYKYVIPYKGWNSYRQVNLAFTNQLICA